MDRSIDFAVQLKMSLRRNIQIMSNILRSVMVLFLCFFPTHATIGTPSPRGYTWQNGLHSLFFPVFILTGLT